MAEAVIQMMHQTLVHKLQLLHQDKSLPVFPSGFGDVSKQMSIVSSHINTYDPPHWSRKPLKLDQEGIGLGPCCSCCGVSQPAWKKSQLGSALLLFGDMLDSCSGWATSALAVPQRWASYTCCMLPLQAALLTSKACMHRCL